MIAHDHEADIHEYDRIRGEILHNITSYHSIRNLMYVTTATILGFNESILKSTYVVLLPLIVILPSYIIFWEYWRATVRQATYLMVFYEDDDRNNFKWDTRAARLSKHYKQPNYTMWWRQTPYLLCAIVCIAVYFVKITNEPNIFNFILFILSIVITIYVFARFRSVDSMEYIGGWLKVRNEEKNSTINTEVLFYDAWSINPQINRWAKSNGIKCVENDPDKKVEFVSENKTGEEMKLSVNKKNIREIKKQCVSDGGVYDIKKIREMTGGWKKDDFLAGKAVLTQIIDERTDFEIIIAIAAMEIAVIAVFINIMGQGIYSIGMAVAAVVLMIFLLTRGIRTTSRSKYAGLLKIIDELSVESIQQADIDDCGGQQLSTDNRKEKL